MPRGWAAEESTLWSSPMKHLLEDTRVLVADGAYALVLRNDGDGMFPNLIHISMKNEFSCSLQR